MATRGPEKGTAGKLFTHKAFAIRNISYVEVK
jgi:hypothetical protein